MAHTNIDARADIHSSADLADDVEVGPWTTIGPGVRIDEGTRIASHVVIKGPCEIGKHNTIYQFSSVGEATPDLKYKGELTRLCIGDNNVIREGVTIHRGTIQDRHETTIGDQNLLMAYVHVGHDSVIGNHCILVNNAALAGHVHIDDWSILGGFTLVHQFCRIGKHCFTGMGSAVGKDIPSFVMVTGAPAEARSINIEGLKRRGFSKDDIALIVKAFKIVYRRGNTLSDALLELRSLTDANQHLKEFIQSIESSTRGILR